MHAPDHPVEKDLVLIGGGHAHVAAIKSIGMKPIPGVRLTVIARDVHTPYSGMLPGLIAGHYNFDETHIDLRPLSVFAGARLYHDEALRIDPDRKLVHCKGRPPVPYDLLSINIGSTPDLRGLKGAAEFAVPVKPINRFAQRWAEVEARMAAHTGPLHIGVIGAGAGGVELVLAIQHRLNARMRELGHCTNELTFHLISKSDRILPAFPRAVAARFDRVLDERRIKVHTGSTVTAVSSDHVMLADGTRIALDETLIVTQGTAAEWPGASGLPVDADGFIQVEDTLQVQGHVKIFAAGDIARMINHARPRAGVFAVRQGEALTENLRRTLAGEAPRPFRPQKSILALISTGDKYAVASKGPFSAQGSMLWRWKDWIDRRFMDRFNRLPGMATGSGDAKPEPMRCGGCGAKIGPRILGRALANVSPIAHPETQIGLDNLDDAAVIEIPPRKQIVQSVDYLKAIVDDPYTFGKIAANHSLNDIYAMGATAHSAMAIATLPFGPETKTEEILSQLMAGANETLELADVSLVGGHTSEGADLSLGFSVTGFADANKLLRKSGVRSGDLMVLTKPIGTGTLFAANMQRKARGRWIEAALAAMIQSNLQAAACVAEHGATACTDVSGFGLLGHLLEMLEASDVHAKLRLDALPLLDGAEETAASGFLSSLHPANAELQGAVLHAGAAIPSARFSLLSDPQTSGGLLASIPATQAEACVLALRALGYEAAAVIGQATPRVSNTPPVTLQNG